MTTFQIVVRINATLTSLTTTDLAGLCAANDIAVTAIHHGDLADPDLSGLPILRGFAGPTRVAPGVVRYACPESVRDLAL